MKTYTVETTITVWLHGDDGAQPIELLAAPAFLQRKVHTIARALASALLVEGPELSIAFDWIEHDEAQ